MSDCYRIYSIKICPEKVQGHTGAFNKSGALMDVATSILAHKIDTGSCKIAIWTDHDKPFAPSTLRIEINSLKDFHLVHTNAIVALKKVAPNGIKVRRRFKQYYFGMPDY